LVFKKSCLTFNLRGYRIIFRD